MSFPPANYVPPSDQSGDISIHLGSPSGGTHFVFPVGLEGLTLTMGSRAVTTQALDAFWCDALGPAVPTLTLTGHTGWRALRDGLDGKQQFIKLVTMHKDHERLLAKYPNNRASLLLLHDATADLTLWCFATSLRISRDKTQALLFPFEWDLTVVRKVDPAAPSLGRSSSSSPSQGAQTSTSSPKQAGIKHSADALRNRNAATVPGDAIKYIVQSGDTLSALVKTKYNATTWDQQKRYIDAVMRYPANNGRIQDADHIYPGEVIWFPRRIT